MKVAQALDNFNLVSRTRAFLGWDASPVCTWTGIECSPQRTVIGVNFTQALPAAQPMQPNAGHDIMLTGTLGMLTVYLQTSLPVEGKYERKVLMSAMWDSWLHEQRLIQSCLRL